MWASAESKPEMVAYLISKSAKVNIRAAANDWSSQMTNEPRVQYRPTGGLTPLLYAARAGCRGCVEALLKGGADIDMPNPDGMTPMLMAIDKLNMLQPGRNGSSGRFKDDLLNTGATPLLGAAQTFDNDVVQVLLDHGALVDLPNAMGVTPFMAAAGIGTPAYRKRFGARPSVRRRTPVDLDHGNPAQGRRGCECS
jgi:ankyrin repeat protein